MYLYLSIDVTSITLNVQDTSITFTRIKPAKSHTTIFDDCRLFPGRKDHRRWQRSDWWEQ